MKITVIDKKDIKRKEAVIRELFDDDIEKYLKLQEDVYDSLSDKSQYVKMSKEEIKNALGSLRGIPLGIFIGKELLGAWIAISYGDCRENLARDLNLPKKEHSRTITFDTAILHPRLRGQKINSIMAKQIMQAVKSKGFIYSVATIEPKNYASLSSVLGAGHAVVARKSKYGGLDRYIILANLKNPINFDIDNPKIIDCNNVDEIEKYLTKGYAGTRLLFTENSVNLVLEKMLQKY